LKEYPFVVCDFIPLHLFKQICGIAMGTNCSPDVANLSLAYYELNCDQALHTIFPFARFLDDICVIHQSHLDPLPILNQIYRPTGLNLISSGKQNNNTIYLDIQIPSPQSLKKSFEFGVFCKPFTNYEYPHFNSCIPRSIHTGLVVGGFHRLYNRHSHLDQFKWAFNNYIRILHQRGYPRAWVLKTLRITLKKSSLNKKEKDMDYHLIMDFQPKIHLLTFFSIMEQFNSNGAIGIHQHPIFIVGLGKQKIKWKMHQLHKKMNQHYPSYQLTTQYN
jgi:hypothetical protein